MLKGLNVFVLCINAALSIVLTLTIGALIEERSKDIVRLTVSDKELLSTVQQSQGLTHRIASAYPLNKDETRWRVLVNGHSKVIN